MSEAGAGFALEQVHVENIGVLRDVTLPDLRPLTVVFGPNGTGKSTLLDALALLRDCVAVNVRSAFAARGGIRALRTRGSTGPVVVALGVRRGEGRWDYEVTFDAGPGADAGPDVVVSRERLVAVDDRRRVLLDLRNGAGHYDQNGVAQPLDLVGPDVLGLDVLGQLNRAPFSDLWAFVGGWRTSRLGLRTRPSAAERYYARSSASEVLAPTGENLTGAVAGMERDRPQTLRRINETISRWVPGAAGVQVRRNEGGPRLALVETDEGEVDEEAMSDGTRHLLGLLTQLFDAPGTALLLEEPENHVHPGLHQRIAEECRSVAGTVPVVTTTHSPHFVDALGPDEAWLMFRGADGFAQVRRATDVPRLMHMIEAGGLVGDLWMEGHFGVGAPGERFGA